MPKKDINRREFITRASAGLFSTGMGLSLFKGNSLHGKESQKIIYRTLGRTKLRIPIVSFGVMNSDNPDLLQQAMDLGVTHLDTAFLYLNGNSERMIGKVLEETGKRDKVIIATKMRFNRDREKHVFLLEGAGVQPAATEENFNKQLETSLGRLRTDYIDILYLHSCYSPAMATFEPLLNALVKAKKAGKAKFIGMSTHRNEPDVIRATVDTGVYDVVLTSYNYLQKHREEVKKAIQYAAGKGLGVVAMKTQGGVQLNEEKKIEVNHKAALKWVLNDKNVCTTIPGITTYDQLALDFSVMQDLALTGEEKGDLNLTAMISGTLFCQNCRTCIPSCPKKVEIPTLMRAYMYANGYGNLVQAQLTTEELPAGRNLAVCRECGSCAASCPNGITIGRRLKKLIDYRFV